MSMYNLIEYSDNYAKTLGSLWQYFRDEPDDNLADSESFKSKIKITGKTPNNDNENDVEIMVPLKYLSSFWRTLEMPLINCQVNLILTWSSTCVITNSTGAGRFEITDTRIYVPVATLSTQENTKLLQQLESGFKRVINWNKHLSKPALLAQNPNLNHLVETSFQGVNRFFVLAFENDAQRTSNSGYYLSNSQLNKLKSATKNEADVVLRLSSNMIGNSDDNTNFPHELLLTNRQVSNLCKAFAKNTSTDIKLSKTQLSKMIQSGGFLGRLLGPLLRTGLPLMKSVIKPLAKSVLVPLGLAAAASAADAGNT